MYGDDAGESDTIFLNRPSDLLLERNLLSIGLLCFVDSKSPTLIGFLFGPQLRNEIKGESYKWIQAAISNRTLIIVGYLNDTLRHEV